MMDFGVRRCRSALLLTTALMVLLTSGLVVVPALTMAAASFGLKTRLSIGS